MNHKLINAATVALGSSLTTYYLGVFTRKDGSTRSTVPLSSVDPIDHNTSMSNSKAAGDEIAALIGRDHISTRAVDRDGHASSEHASHLPNPAHVPSMVVFPGSTEDVSGVMKICHRRRIPVIAYGGGTSIEGHYTDTRGGLCMDFGRMDQIIKLLKEDLDVVVQPAIGCETLNEQLAQDNLFLPPDPRPGAMIGGMVGTGCSGTNAYRYGTMKDWVLGLTVVLADGTIIRTRQRPQKSSARYDLTRMFIGSEGTLGLVTEATLKVTVKPSSTSAAVCSFDSVRNAAKCVSNVVGHGIPIVAMEIIDDVQMKCINLSQMTARRWDEAPTWFFKFAGTTSGVQEQVEMVQQLAKITGSKSFDFARSQEEQEELWSARKASLWAVMALREEGDQVWTGDVAVPVSRLSDIIEENKTDISQSGMIDSIVGHVGDGNFHSR